MSVKITKTLTPPPAFTQLRDVTPPAGDGSDNGRAWVWDHAAGKFRSGVVSTIPVPTPLPAVQLPTGGTVQDSEARRAIHDIIYALQAAVIIAPSGAFTDVSVGDSFALGEFYAATGGPNWNNNTGWAPDAPGYTGLAADAVGVSVADGRVTGLYSINNNMTGTFPAAFLPSALKTYSVWGSINTVNITGSIADAPSVKNWKLAQSGSTLSADAHEMPDGLTRFDARYNSGINVGGTLGDLPTSLTHLELQATASTLSGGDAAIQAAGIQLLNFQETDVDPDGIIARIYTDRANFTGGLPRTLNISNTAPVSTTAEAQIADLTNATLAESEGRAAWMITYDASAT